MKQNTIKILIGVVIVAVGLNMILKKTGVEFNIFFDGWYAIPIIIIAALSIANHGVGAGNLIMLLVGVWLLINEQEWLPVWIETEYIWGAAVVAVGLMFLFGNRRKAAAEEQVEHNRHTETHRSFDNHEDYKNSEESWEKRLNDEDNEPEREEPRFNRPRETDSHPTYTAIFGGQTIHNSSDSLDGSTLFSLFGGLEVDFRNAVIDHDIVIDVTSIFGGADLRFPPHVRVVTKGIPIFGGVDNKSHVPPDANAPIVTVRCLVAFGGVDILP